MRARAARVAFVVASSLALAATAGCTKISPYQRGKLAHPTMTAADLSGYAEAHVRAVHEGATGGAQGSGSGCGCN